MHTIAQVESIDQEVRSAFQEIEQGIGRAESGQLADRVEYFGYLFIFPLRCKYKHYIIYCFFMILIACSNQIKYKTHMKMFLPMEWNGIIEIKPK